MRDADIDALTGLPNHRAVVVTLRDLLGRAQRGDFPLSVLVVDIDDFGAINRVYGPNAGDAILRGLASVLRANLPPAATLGRLGGDEYLAILPAIGGGAARDIAGRVRGAARHRFAAGVVGGIDMSCAVGVATYPDDAREIDHLIVVADYTAREDKPYRPGGGGAAINPAIIDRALQHVDIEPALFSASEALAPLGRALHNNTPRASRPAWAATMLASVYPYVRRAPEVDAVLEIGRDPNRWHEAHSAFSAVRGLWLRLDAEGQLDDVYSAVLYLAELVAKVTYNASRPRDPFDADAGWYLVAWFKRVVDLLDDPAVRRRAWAIAAGNMRGEPPAKG